MSMKTADNANKDLRQLHDLADKITQKQRSIGSVSSKARRVRSLLIALKDFELDKKVRAAALKEAVENCDELVYTAEILDGNKQSPGSKLPVLYDRRGNRSVWVEDEWLPCGTLLTPPWARE